MQKTGILCNAILGDDEVSNGNGNKTDEPSAFIDLLGGDDLLPPKNQSGKFYFALTL